MASPPSKPHEPNLPSGDVLVGTGDRTVKLGFVQIQVYSLGLYVEPNGCRSALLSEYAGSSHDALLRAGPTFYEAFVSGKFRKTFKLTFCRSLTREKLLGGFGDPLKSRVDPDRASDAEAVLSDLVPPSGSSDDDVMTVECGSDGKTFVSSWFTKSTGETRETVRIESGGDGGVWTAYQNLFFDENTAVPTIRHGAIADLPNVLVGGGEEEEGGGGGPLSSTSSSVKPANPRQPSKAEIEAAVDEEFAGGGGGGGRKKQGKMTWKKFAGREDGKDGFQFGDVALGVAKTVGITQLMRVGQGGAGSNVEDAAARKKFGGGDGGGGDGGGIDKVRVVKRMVPGLSPTPSSATSEEDSKRIREQSERLDDLEAETDRLRSDLKREEDLLAEANRTMPLKVAAALALAEILGLIVGMALELSVLGLARVKLSICAAGGAAAYMHYHSWKSAEKAKEA